MENAERSVCKGVARDHAGSGSQTLGAATLNKEGLKIWQSWWLPAGETHLIRWMELKQQRDSEGRICYQKHKLDAALKMVRDFRSAVDVGAHCGLWSRHLVRAFKSVHAFEPVELHRRAFGLNVNGDKVTLYPYALGEADDLISMKSDPASSGDSVVAGPGNIPMRRMDDVLSDVSDVDFMKLDCEGYELHALRGGEELLKRCRPVVCVEQKPGKAQSFGLTEIGAVEYLQSLGAKVRMEIGGDFLLSWD